ncbi:MAG TPA: filamentous hemagglutinin N-terminal domain-containing protein, partial [Luteibacter sp.]|nr:filamentous hemagglutinin N-terminal domain-containing protein [Luteibacter sp.]
MKTAPRPQPFARTASTLATAIAIALLGLPFGSHAQVTPANGAQRPGIDVAANGVGVVNIVAPSKAGVSHNQYNDFNVDKRGLILNNAANVTPSQLAGYVVGNPNLQPGQSARIILNEVVSTNRSALNGALEVAGNRADVIVANPNGILVGGATFINTSKATLTTGTPVFGGDGSLNAFRVNRGAIEIAGAGLDASLTDRLDIIARNVIANGKVWANQLNVIAGANQVERDSLATQAIAGEGAAPDVAIDVAALGGMYANHIFMRASDAGIGVRNAGELASAGGFEVDTTGQLTVTGKLIAADGLAVNAGVIDNAATVAATSVTLTGERLTNRGTIQSTGDAVIRVSGAIDQNGTLRSDGRTDVQAGSVVNTGTLYVAGPLTLAAGAITNTGALASAADLWISGASLRSTGTLGAGVAADGSLSGSGALNVVVAGALIATGRNLAAGRMALSGGALDLSGATTRAGSDIALISTTGDIDLHGGDLATAYALDMRAALSLNNIAGTVQAGQLGITAGALDNRGGQLLQTGSAASTLTVTGALDNAGGRLASNAGDLTIRAGTLGNAGGTIEHAGTGTARVTVDGGLDNTGGRLLGNGGLEITTGGALTNTRGTLSAAREATFHLGALDNSDGTVIAQALTVLVQGDVANHGGTLQAQALGLSAANLINGNGQVKALDGALSLTLTQLLSNAAGGFIGGNAAVTLGAGALANAGQIYAGNDLALTSQGQLANTGAVQAMGSATISAGAIDNRTGRIEAGSGTTDATLTIATGSLDNTGGRLANAATGATSVTVTGALTNTAGTLGGQGDVTLTANTIDNTGGATLVAGNDLSLFTGYLDNSSGTLYAARHLAWSNDAATLLNRQGQLGAGGNASLTLAALDNTGGETAANGDVTLALGNLAGIGRVVAGHDLAIRLPGDYTNLAGNRLQANGAFRFDLGGHFVNAAGAVLDAVQGLALSATAITNAGLINSAATTLTSAGDLTNTGRIEGDTLEVRAANVLNIGTLIGGALTVHAANLTNGADLGDAVDNTPYQSALIAATDRVALYIGGTLLNRDALIYSMGDIVIAADEAGARSAAVINRSGSIEADGNLSLAASQITNERRVLATERHVLNAAEQAANTTVGAPWVRYREDDPDPLHHPPYVLPEQMIGAEELALAHAFCAGNHQDDYRCVGYDFGDFVNGRPISFNAITTSVVTAVTRLTRASAEGRILAGGDMVLSGSVLNDSSTIAAGRHLSINGQAGGMGDGTQIIGGETVRNLSFVPTAEITDTTRYGVQYQYLKHTDDGHTWIWDGFETYRTGNTNYALGLGTPPAWITLDPGRGLSARISAGGGLTIVGTDIQNTAVDANGNPVAGVGLGSNAGGQPVAGAGPAPGAQLVGDAAHPIGAITVPTGGLYTVHPGTGAGYLIETDPRFASQSGFLGSDYLMNRLGFNGESLLKRLGDAFYETRLVLDQITSLTGRRYLDGNSDATAQYRALMDSGVAAAGKFDLAVGVALTPEQMASLTTDIVWMVSQQVNGESVLVPVVYLSAATANNVASGASLSGTTVALDASGTLTNGGAIQASQDASLKAGTLLNAGQVAATGHLSLSAAQDLLSTGTIQGGNVALVAGRDLTAEGHLTATGDLGLTAGRDLGLDRVALNAGTDLSLAAGRDLTATASQLSAGG